jgi:hypothetical protein
MIRGFVFLGAGALLLSTVAAQSGRAQDASSFPPILQKFMAARKAARYSGVRTVEFKRDAERKRHVEFVLKDGVRSRTEFPEGSEYHGQIIVDNGKQRMHFFPDRNEIDVEPARSHEGRESGGRSPRRLIRTVSPGGAVAGHETQLVNVADDSGNVVQKMWIEPKSGVRLKLVLFDRVGSQSGYYEFTKINFKPNFARGDFELARKGATIITPSTRARRLAEKHGFTAIVLGHNSGYELHSARIIHPEQKDVLVQTYVGKEGRFSFFQLKGEVDQKRLARFARGRLSTYSWKRGHETFAIVGNLTQDQLRQIAKTLGDA